MSITERQKVSTQARESSGSRLGDILQAAESRGLSTVLPGKAGGVPMHEHIQALYPTVQAALQRALLLEHSCAFWGGGGGGVHGGKENQLAGPDEWDSWRKRLPCRQTCLCLTEGRGGCCLATVAAQGQAGRGQASDQEGGTVGMFQDGAQQLAPRAGGRKGSSQPKTQFL